MRKFLTDILEKYIYAFLPKFLVGHPWDYVLHFVFSFAGVFLFYYILSILGLSQGLALTLAFILMFGIGLFKEFYIDIPRGEKHILGDILGDAGGVFLAVIVIALI